MALPLCVLARVLAPGASEAHRHPTSPVGARGNCRRGEGLSAHPAARGGGRARARWTVLELSLPCGRGRLLLRDAFVPLLGETCPGRALVFGSVCSSPSACVITELLLWMLRPLNTPRIYGRPLLWARWLQVTIAQVICQPVCRRQGWLRMEPWQPAFS